jgi:putative chitinase
MQPPEISIVTLTREHLLAVFPHLSAALTAALTAAMAERNINTPRRVASFLGQTAVESQMFTQFEENLDYSVDRLLVVWPRRFPTLGVATPYARNPEALANRVYAGRLGNGDEASGDGWRYRGAGAIQLTGRDNQGACALAFGIPPDDVGAWLRGPEGACRSAGWFWQREGLNALADADNQIAVTMRVNGGAIGLERRIAATSAVLRVLS